MALDWIRYRAVAYLTGRGVTWGMDKPVLNPNATSPKVFSLLADQVKTPISLLCDKDLSVIADGTLDHLFVGKRLESVEDPAAFLRHAVGKLKIGGHLIVAVPLTKAEEWIPNEFIPEGVEGLVAGLPGAWLQKSCYVRDGWTLQIYKRLKGHKPLQKSPPPQGKRACIVRYGALGDAVMVTPLIRALAGDGYAVTLNCVRYALPVFENNPYISNIILQERDAIRNEELGPYWDEWSQDYDRYINLSESIEGKLLKVEGRPEFFTHQAWRIKTGETNYYDHTMRLGGYERVGTRGELFFTPEEEKAAQQFFAQYENKFVILWSMNGSSHHKIYPFFEQVATEWVEKNPDSVILTLGDDTARLLEIDDHPRIVPMCGKWTVRQSAIATKYAGCVIGPESFVINCAGCWDTPKVPLLSHSTHKALCGNFVNDYCLAPDPAEAPCHPCFKLIYSKQGCPLKVAVDANDQEIGPPIPCCTLAISPERVMARLDEVKTKHFRV